MANTSTLEPTCQNGVADFKAFRASLFSAGVIKKEPVRVVLELLFHIAVVTTAMTLFVLYNDFTVRFSSMIVLSVGCLGISTNTHTSSHYATSHRRWLNEGLTYFGYSFLMGFSANYWWQKHGVHHKHPNMVGVDTDIDLMPVFAMTSEEFDRSKGMARAFYSIQWVVFPFALALNSLNMQRYSVQFLLGKIIRDRRTDRRFLIDAVLMLLHFLLWLIVPMFFFSWSSVLGFYVCQRVIFGYLMFSVFAPSHYPHEAAFVRQDGDTGNYVLSQTATTVNYRTGWIGRMMCSGLQYQIEHHLFPDVSHTCYPRLSARVREYCNNHGYPYREISWDLSLWKSLLVLYKPKKVEDQLNFSVKELSRPEC